MVSTARSCRSIDRTQLSVEYENELDERLSPAAETAGYFVVLEALTNVLQHAGVTQASVRVRRDPGGMLVEVEDHGAGGADPGLGTGLRELEDRVAALDGTLTVLSPAGDGTRVIARIPATPIPVTEASARLRPRLQELGRDRALGERAHQHVRLQQRVDEAVPGVHRRRAAGAGRRGPARRARRGSGRRRRPAPRRLTRAKKPNSSALASAQASTTSR